MLSALVKREAEEVFFENEMRLNTNYFYTEEFFHCVGSPPLMFNIKIGS